MDTPKKGGEQRLEPEASGGGLLRVCSGDWALDMCLQIGSDGLVLASFIWASHICSLVISSPQKCGLGLDSHKFRLHL
jgi:hypothetical protein